MTQDSLCGQMHMKVGDLNDSAVHKLLQEHIDDMFRTSPPESVHTLDLDSLKKPDISFWCLYNNQALVGCVALKEHDNSMAEIKSMRTSNASRGTGAGKVLMEYLLEVARQRGYNALNLETGSQDFFEPARRLYLKYGFAVCGPFADYCLDPNSVFMSKRLI